jgi:hypothetical protein
MKPLSTSSSVAPYTECGLMSEETIAELFRRAGQDPGSFTGPDDPDITRIVEHMRGSRAAFKSKGVATDQPSKPKPTLDELGF